MVARAQQFPQIARHFKMAPPVPRAPTPAGSLPRNINDACPCSRSLYSSPASRRYRRATMDTPKDKANHKSVRSIVADSVFETAFQPTRPSLASLSSRPSSCLFRANRSFLRTWTLCAGKFGLLNRSGPGQSTNRQFVQYELNELNFITEISRILPY